MGKIISECSNILQMIRSRASTKPSYATDMAHNLTWSNDVFPLIHNSLLGSIVAVYLGFGGASAIVADALGLTDASVGFQFKIDAKKVTKLEKFA